MTSYSAIPFDVGPLIMGRKRFPRMLAAELRFTYLIIPMPLNPHGMRDTLTLQNAPRNCPL
jgi:hypothetical protein